MSRGNGKPPSFLDAYRKGTRMVSRETSKRQGTHGATLIDAAPVADLSAERLRRVEGAGQAAHERGEAFAIAHYVFDGMVGHDLSDPPDRELEVIFVTDGALSAIGMSALDAIRLGEALIEAGKAAPSMNPKPENAG